jgi:cyclophilin family peptidyl-prolyl cis-trans isomerase
MFMKTRPARSTKPHETTQTAGGFFGLNSGEFVNRSLRLLVLALVIIGVFVSCGGKKTAVKDFDTESDEDPALQGKATKGVKPVADAEVAVIETVDFGTIVLELYPNIAPRMVERFKKLISQGFYNGTTFHRINAESGLIQGGDPLSKDNDPRNDGSGDSTEPNVPGEMSDIPYDRGTVGAARKGAIEADGVRPGLTEAQARDTANCQFFITLKPQPEYDRRYTVFGRVIQGIDVAEIVMRAPVSEDTEQAAEKIVIKNITLQPRSKFVSAS